MKRYLKASMTDSVQNTQMINPMGAKNAAVNEISVDRGDVYMFGNVLHKEGEYTFLERVPIYSFPNLYTRGYRNNIKTIKKKHQNIKTILYKYIFHQPPILKHRTTTFNPTVTMP